MQFCCKCITSNFPFSNLTDSEFQLLSCHGISDCPGNRINIFSDTQNEYLNKISDVLHRTSIENEDEITNSQKINCNYYSPKDFTDLKINNNKSFSFYHLNIHSIQKHMEELKIMLTMLCTKFDILAITETKISKNIGPLIDISIDGYHPPIRTDTEASKGGTLLYIRDHLNFKPRTHLEKVMYSPKELESTFVEIINPQNVNTIVGSIYRHPCMDGDDFNENFLRPFICKLSNKFKK